MRMFGTGSVVGLCLLAAGVTGCGGGAVRPETAKVTGTVTYKSNPVESATITFRQLGAARVASGTTDASGKFSLSTFDTNDGAVIGEHAVVIAKVVLKSPSGTGPMTSPEDYVKAVEKSGATAPPGSENSEDVIPSKYANPDTSGLVRTVDSGIENVFNFELVD